MICSVGLICLDVVNFVPIFPVEDTDTRCTNQTWARGGNASNNATVFASLGLKVEFFGTLADDYVLPFLKSDMEGYGIDYKNCPIVKGDSRSPSSVVLCSAETGTRTIVHSKGNLRELTLLDFETVILGTVEKYSWIHFEGRNEMELNKIINSVHEYNVKHPKEFDNNISSTVFEPTYKKVRLPISIEIEKTREELGILIPMAHILFVGKDFSILQGANNCVEAVRIIAEKVAPGTVIICPWGELGAAFTIKDETNQLNITKVDAFQPSVIVDSLGAGDTFIASTIFALHHGNDVESSVRFGCKIASEKLSLYGFKELKTVAGSHIASFLTKR